MASDEAYDFVVTVPAGTPASAPVTTNTRMPDRIITEIRWHVPRGHNGLVGFRITMGGVAVIPRNVGGWIIRDGISESRQMQNLPSTGAWDVTAYNTGANNHSIYITFLAELIRPALPQPSVLPVYDLSDLNDLSRSGPPAGRRP